jgi:plasmid stability protein
MTTVTINLPDQKAAALKAKATAHGLTLEDWIAQRLAEDESEAPSRSPLEAAARIRELQKHVKPDPEGWTVRDYINFGRR